VTADTHARQRAKLAARVEKELWAAWRRVDRGAIRESWAAQIPRLLVFLTTAQAVAAASADSFVSGTLGADSPYEIDPRAFTLSASDGRPLETLLAEPPIISLTEISRGVVTLDRAMAAGELTARLIGHTQTADAGRVADLTAAVANPAARSWTRMVVGKTCARCLVLAGRRYSWKADFNRHPKCDCIAVPSAEAVSVAAPVNPMATFRAMDRQEQDRVFGQAGAEAIRNGADMAQVVNARSGVVTVAGRSMTTSGARRRRPRLMPEQIFREARGDRAETIRLLSLHGYIRRRAQGSV
jgi:hypothetical protein